MRNHKKELIIVFFLIFGIVHSTGVYAASLSTLRMDIIQSIESSGNSLAFNKKENARGLFQLREGVLLEWNKKHFKYTMNDLWNVEINKKIATWYLNKRIPEMLRHFNKKVDIRNIIISYNAGIKNVLTENVPTTTERYLKKYVARGGTI